MSIPSRYRKPYQHKSQVPLDPASTSDGRTQVLGSQIPLQYTAAGMGQHVNNRDYENLRSGSSSPNFRTEINAKVYPYYAIPSQNPLNQLHGVSAEQYSVRSPGMPDYNKFKNHPNRFDPSRNDNTMRSPNLPPLLQHTAAHNPHKFDYQDRQLPHVNASNLMIDPRNGPRNGPRNDSRNDSRNDLGDQRPNADNITKLLKATKGTTQPSSNGQIPPKTLNVRNKSSRYNMAPVTEIKVPIMLPNRLVFKTLHNTDTAASLITRLITEHRLEFDSEALVLWEEIAATFRRPLREQEKIYEVIKKWPTDSKIQFTVTSDALRYDERSLASLAPRRDMLRQLPSIIEAEVQFSVPSREYEFTWGKGAVSLVEKQLILRQKYDSNKIVCQCPTEKLDVYEIADKTKARKCPLKYTLAFKQQIEGGIIVVSTDSAKLTSELRNAIFTSRTRFLQLNKAA